MTGGLDMDIRENPAGISMGLREPHSDFQEEMVSLGGKWRFFLQSAQLPLPEGWEQPDFDDKKWRRIAVPGSWEAQDVFDDCASSADTSVPVSLSQQGCRVDRSRNLLGLYRRSFTLSQPHGSRRIILRLEHIPSAARVWVNGVCAGFSKSISAPAEFDITDTVRPEKNTVCILVYRWSEAACLDSGVPATRSGLLGDVKLYSLPARCVTDIRWSLLQTEGGGKELIVRMRCREADGFSVRVALMDGTRVAGYCQCPINGSEATARIICPDITLWTAETPKLYRIAVILWDGVAIYHTAQITTGLRTIRADGPRILVNDRPEVLFAADYQPYDSQSGGFLSTEKLEHDLTRIRAHHFNAIRLKTPAPGALYALCDRIGLYILDGSAPVSSAPELQELIAHNHTRLEGFFGSHCSIIAWNQNSGDCQIPQLNQFVLWNGPDAAQIQRLLHDGEPKSEKSHSKAPTEQPSPSPSLLSLKEMPQKELADVCRKLRQNPRMTGGIFGTFRSTEDTTGYSVLCDAEDRLTPAIRRAQAVFQPISMEFDQGTLTIFNHSAHRSTSALECRYILTRDGEPILSRSLSLDAAPGGSAQAQIETKYDIYKPGRYHLTVEFSEKDSVAPLASCQWPVGYLRHIYDENPGGTIREDGGNILLRSGDCAYSISRATGNLEQILYKDCPLLTGAAHPVYTYGRSALGLRLPSEWERLSARKKKIKPSVVEVDHLTRTVTASFHLASGLMQAYRLHSDGSLAVELRLRTGRTAPQRLGLRLDLAGSSQTLQWFGYGPDDTLEPGSPGGCYGVHTQTIGSNPCMRKEPVYSLSLTAPESGTIRARSEDGFRVSAEQIPNGSALILELPTGKMKPHTTYFFSFTLFAE